MRHDPHDRPPQGRSRIHPHLTRRVRKSDARAFGVDRRTLGRGMREHAETTAGQNVTAANDSAKITKFVAAHSVMRTP